MSAAYQAQKNPTPEDYSYPQLKGELQVCSLYNEFHISQETGIEKEPLARLYSKDFTATEKRKTERFHIRFFIKIGSSVFLLFCYYLQIST